MLRDQNPFWTHRLFQLPGIPLACWSCKSVLSVQTFRLRNPSLPVERGSKRFHTHQQFNDASEACLIANRRRFLHLNYRLKVVLLKRIHTFGDFWGLYFSFRNLKKNYIYLDDSWCNNHLGTTQPTFASFGVPFSRLRLASRRARYDEALGLNQKRWKKSEFFGV